VLALAEHYDEVVLLATGSEAVKLLLGKDKALGRFEQGIAVDVAGVSCCTFATYLAAALLPGRDPSKAVAVGAHLDLAREYLETGRLRMEIVPDELDYTSRIPPDADLVSLDIETYGACHGFPVQRFFHPAKSIEHDRVAAEDLVLTCGVAWRTRSGALEHRLYRLTKPKDRYELFEDLSSLKHPVILGQNVPFDVMYLRAWAPEFRMVLKPFDKVQLIDLAVLNFLECDQRPERSLKRLSPLLRTYNYAEERVDLRKGERYAGPDDPALHRYNVVDAIATLRNYEILRASITRKFGPDSQKGSPRCLSWYSDLLWFCITMMENGVKYDVQALGRLHDKLERKIEVVGRMAAERFGAVLTGKGSKKYQDELAVRAARAFGLIGDKRLQLTDRYKAVSSGRENLNLFLGQAKPGSELRLELRLLKRHRQLSKLHDTYTRPMLGLHKPKASEKQIGRDLNNALIDGIAYPTWYPVPSRAAESSEDEGGTKQARITSKGPALQTQPGIVEDCQCSRHADGAMIRGDESQLEYRVAAMYSHDPDMVAIYQDGRNIHREVASLCAGFEVEKSGHPRWYHAGKTANFQSLFMGSARGFQETLRREIGLDLPIGRAEQILGLLNERRKRFRSWQLEQIKTAKARGYSELPILGISRTFLGGSHAIERTYIPTIVNFPIQSTAALLTLSAQVAMERWLRANQMRTLSVSNTYDEAIYDAPADEVRAVTLKLRELLNHPPLYDEFVAAGLFPLPLDSEIKTAYNLMQGEEAPDGRSACQPSA
jgi:DNA polymerase I-like protein with 3'-5' exonuclease and polymerase domains